jgi:hypothetical protein
MADMSKDAANIEIIADILLMAALLLNHSSPVKYRIADLRDNVNDNQYQNPVLRLKKLFSGKLPLTV